VTREDRTEVMTLSYREAWIDRTSHRIYARDYPGQEPAIVLLHGFPDYLHLYDRLVPYLNPPRRVVTFDFLGWGDSDKPARYPYTATNQTGDLDAVIGQLGLDQVTIVDHDASGPPGIDWALEHPDRVAGLILLNTYYCLMPTLRPPEAIALYSTPLLRTLVRGLARASDRFDRGLYMAGRAVHQPRPDKPGAGAAPVPGVPDGAARLLGAEQRPSRHGHFPDAEDPGAAAIRPAGTDHLRRARPLPEQGRRPPLPPAVSGREAVPGPGRPSLRPGRQAPAARQPDGCGSDHNIASQILQRLEGQPSRP
jgi:pimeloyl-ACP methyl ester carboxylesterase